MLEVKVSFAKLTSAVMSKTNSPSSNHSGTSSETSETQSVEDNNPNSIGAANVSSRIPANWKRMNLKDSNSDKDAESKRPPWRTVSVSTLPKPDKSALLRAKLLDASRRLRAGKCSVALQTDISPTKLMKEVNIGTQIDLILYKEVGILTDGSYTKKKEGSDEFILSYSVSQLTDVVEVKNISTQTLLPKVIGDDFMEAYFNINGTARNSNQFTDIERKLLDQVCKIREFKKLRPEIEQRLISNNVSAPNSKFETAAMVSAFTEDKSINADILTLQSNVRPSLLKPTFASWRFEYDGIERGSNSNFIPYTINPGKTLSSFAPMLYTYSGHQLFNWNLLLTAVDELIHESNRLVDAIVHLTPKQSEGLDTKLQTFKPQQHIFPSDHWLPIIEQQEKKLNEIMKNAKHSKIHKLRKLKKMNIDKNEKASM